MMRSVADLNQDDEPLITRRNDVGRQTDASKACGRISLTLGQALRKLSYRFGIQIPA